MQRGRHTGSSEAVIHQPKKNPSSEIVDVDESAEYVCNDVPDDDDSDDSDTISWKRLVQKDWKKCVCSDSESSSSSSSINSTVTNEVSCASFGGDGQEMFTEVGSFVVAAARRRRRLNFQSNQVQMLNETTLKRAVSWPSNWSGRANN